MMKKVFLLSLMFLFTSFCSAYAEGIIGYWKTIDDHSGKPQSIVAIYEYQERYYGRIIATYNDQGRIVETLDVPKSRAPGVVGHPFYVGMDIIWNLQKSGSRFVGGEILDPEKGRLYGAEVWPEGDKLMVRGEILFIGKNQAWEPAHDTDFPPEFKKPNLTQFVPVIPQVLK